MTGSDLSPRQRLVMQYLVDGVSFKVIADKLGIGHGTAKKHAMRAREKVGATSLYQCIALLVARGEIVPAGRDGMSISDQRFVATIRQILESFPEEEGGGRKVDKITDETILRGGVQVINNIIQGLFKELK